MVSELIARKEHVLIESIEKLDNLIIAYSGGVDSSLLAYYARKVLKDRARIVIAISPSLAIRELEAAQLQARLFDWDLIEIHTAEVTNEEYQRNDSMRCYFCKATLFTDLKVLAAKLDIKTIAYGANLDDLADFRPGHLAAKEARILSPLQEAGLTKEEIRMLAKSCGLPSWDRPQAACLSSRFPTFQPVTVDGLSQVERAEDYILSLGFKQVRVRHHGDTARIEIDKEELPTLLANTEICKRLDSALKTLGYSQVIIDENGYQQGGANQS